MRNKDFSLPERVPYNNDRQIQRDKELSPFRAKNSSENSANWKRTSQKRLVESTQNTHPSLWDNFEEIPKLPE